MIRTRLLIPLMIPWVGIAAAACTTTYTQSELDAKEPIAESIPVAPLCTGLDDEPGCEMDNPICVDPGDFRCLPLGE